MKCCVCNLPIQGSYTGMGDGSMKDGGRFAHTDCYEGAQTAYEEGWNAALDEVLAAMFKKIDRLESKGSTTTVSNELREWCHIVKNLKMVPVLDCKESK